jgi:hypothetical protein
MDSFTNIAAFPLVETVSFSDKKKLAEDSMGCCVKTGKSLLLSLAWVKAVDSGSNARRTAANAEMPAPVQKSLKAT